MNPMHRLMLAAALLASSALVTAGCGQAASTQPPVPTADSQAGGSPTQADASSVTPGSGDVAAAQTADEAFVAGGPRFVAAKAVAEGLDAGTDILFVDARPTMDFEFGHIPGAVNVPYFEPEKHLDKLPKDKWIVAYCECPHAEAEQVANALEKNGYSQVRVIDEGLQGWKDLGRELVGGTQ